MVSGSSQLTSSPYHCLFYSYESSLAILQSCFHHCTVLLAFSNRLTLSPVAMKYLLLFQVQRQECSFIRFVSPPCHSWQCSTLSCISTAYCIIWCPSSHWNPPLFAEILCLHLCLFLQALLRTYFQLPFGSAAHRFFILVYKCIQFPFYSIHLLSRPLNAVELKLYVLLSKILVFGTVLPVCNAFQCHWHDAKLSK